VQAGVGNPRPPHEVYTLKEMDAATLRVLDTRKDIACVLVNPIQAMHPNRAAPSDSMLVTGERDVRYDKATYVEWLRKLRDVCTRRGIVLILDEVFLGFRLARGGAQEYFGVRADLVTYGKAVGGGLPIGVVCGRRDLMRRYRDDRPSDICFARGTFNSHPYVMAAMSEFLDHLDRPEVRRTWQGLDERWDARARDLNERLQAAELPLRVANLASVFATTYVEASRFHWMLQYYLRAEGLSFSWVGTGRFIFANDLPDADWSEICDRLVAAATAMQGGGWWWRREGVTNRWIKRRVSRELLAARFARRPSDRAAAL
jgi:glutamate-1-semialdehyde 2,1-aminomutase